jgi:hypothetical protein
MELNFGPKKKFSSNLCEASNVVWVLQPWRNEL